MKTLAEVREEIERRYANQASYVVPVEKINLTDFGHLATGKNEFPLTFDGLDQFAASVRIPKNFFRELEADLRSIISNRRFMSALVDGKIPREIRINLNHDKQIIGFDDPHLLRISPMKLMDVLCSSIPRSLTAEEIKISKAKFSSKRVIISCFSPEKISEPRPGDIINGGIDVVHDITGNTATTVLCYLRRLVCQNGAISHICSEERQLRTRRLNNNRFDENDMLKQIGDRFREAWGQIDSKLTAVASLLDKKRTSLEFLRRERSRFSLNNRMLNAIDQAITQDELGPTDTQYDVFNALSRVATHYEPLSFRQRRTLSHMAGEFSQHNIHRCSECGNWVMSQNQSEWQGGE